MKRKARGFRKGRLQSQIEVVPSQDRSDGKDHDVLPYVDKLIQELQAMQPLEPISLLTPEGAERALNTLEKTLKHLDSQLTIAKSLRNLLEEKKRGQ